MVEIALPCLQVRRVQPIGLMLVCYGRLSVCGYSQCGILKDGWRGMRVLVFSIDDRYLTGFLVLWQSLAETGSLPVGLRVFFLHEDSLSSHARECIRGAVRSTDCCEWFVDVTQVLPRDLPVYAGQHVSRATFYRLFVHVLLPVDVQSIVYLDCDLLALRSCRGLFDWPLAGDVAACDHCSPRISLETWGPEGGAYFQAGVLLIDLEKWRQARIERRFLEVLANERQRLQFHDQDVLNIVFRDAWQRLPVAFNVNQDVVACQSEAVLRETAVLAHFDNPEKPWNSRTRRLFATDWDVVCRRTPGINLRLPDRRVTPLDRLQFYWRRLTRRQ